MKSTFLVETCVPLKTSRSHAGSQGHVLTATVLINTNSKQKDNFKKTIIKKILLCIRLTGREKLLQNKIRKGTQNYEHCRMKMKVQIQEPGNQKTKWCYKLGNGQMKLPWRKINWGKHRKQHLERKIDVWSIAVGIHWIIKGKCPVDSETSKELCFHCCLPVTLYSNEINEPDSSFSWRERFKHPVLHSCTAATQFSCQCNQISPT